jgi:tRNA dimethylallyltransferase
LERVFLAILGPTASGKSDLALALAKELGGEIISADSRQIYKELSAGTAKPKRDADGRVEGVPYHLVDFLDPARPFDAGSFADMARTLISEIKDRGHLPIIAGGTGLYIEALESGLSPIPKGNPSLRQSLMLEAEKRGRKALHQELEKIDPVAAAKTPHNNIHRVVRALEVFRLTGHPISDYWKERNDSEIRDCIHLVIEWPQEAFKLRIKERCEKMWPNILSEVSRLVPKFYSGQEPGFQSLGYPQALKLLQGEISGESGLAELIQKTMAYAKRQRTWFRHQIRNPSFKIIGGPIETMLFQARQALAQKN